MLNENSPEDDPCVQGPTDPWWKRVMESFIVPSEDALVQIPSHTAYIYADIVIRRCETGPACVSTYLRSAALSCSAKHRAKITLLWRFWAPLRRPQLHRHR